MAGFASGPEGILVDQDPLNGDGAKDAGADFVGLDDYVTKIKGGWTDVDVIITTPQVMGKVGALGRVLGPRGLMPNPKSGTVTDDPAKAVKDFKGGKVEFRTDRHANVQVPVGKASFDTPALVANLAAVIEELERLKPSSAKGRYLRKVSLSSTMGPGVSVDPSRVSE